MSPLFIRFNMMFFVHIITRTFYIKNDPGEILYERSALCVKSMKCFI